MRITTHNLLCTCDRWHEFLTRLAVLAKKKLNSLSFNERQEFLILSFVQQKHLRFDVVLFGRTELCPIKIFRTQWSTSLCQNKYQWTFVLSSIGRKQLFRAEEIRVAFDTFDGNYYIFSRDRYIAIRTEQLADVCVKVRARRQLARAREGCKKNDLPSDVQTCYGRSYTLLSGSACLVTCSLFELTPNHHHHHHHQQGAMTSTNASFCGVSNISCSLVHSFRRQKTN